LWRFPQQIQVSYNTRALEFDLFPFSGTVLTLGFRKLIYEEEEKNAACQKKKNTNSNINHADHQSNTCTHHPPPQSRHYMFLSR